MEKLENHPKYFYKSEDTFKSEIDDVHAFPRTDFETGMHIQEFFEINIITRGSGRHYIEDNFVDTCAGDVFIIPPMVRHGFLGGKGFDVFHVLISDRFIDKNMSDLQLLPSFFTLFAVEPLMRGKAKSPLHLRLTVDQFSDMNKLLDDVCKHRNQRDPFDCLVRKGFAVLFIAFLCRVYSQNVESKDESELKEDEGLLNAISYIHEHYFEKISVDMLAKMARFSRSTFIRKFISVCKISPSEYIINRRIDAAEYMLVNTSYSIFDIAFKCGFYDTAHFSKIFTRKKNMTPSEYRKNNFKS